MFDMQGNIVLFFFLFFFFFLIRNVTLAGDLKSIYNLLRDALISIEFNLFIIFLALP